MVLPRCRLAPALTIVHVADWQAAVDGRKSG
jgi:hypothetical protein